MKKLLLLTITLLNSFYFYSQIDSTKIAFVSYWSIGDSYDFKISKTNQQWKENELVKDQKQEYVANFTVIDSTDTSYTIKWSYENDLENTYQIPEALIEKFQKYKLTEIEYKTTEVGDFVEVVNWKEVSEIMTNMFDDIIDVLGDNDENKIKLLVDFMKPLKDVYSSKQGIQEIVLKELQYFHYPLGVEFNITEPLIYDEEIPNMFGGNPIKAKAKLTFESVDFEEGFCTFKQEMKLDSEDTLNMLKEFFSKMNMEPSKLEEILKNAVIEINDINLFEYYYDPGVPHKIETSRESVINIDNKNSKRLDKVIIELIYNE